MVYSELGRYPLKIKIKMVSFWSKLLQNYIKLSSSIYKLLFRLKMVCKDKDSDYIYIYYNNQSLMIQVSRQFGICLL